MNNRILFLANHFITLYSFRKELIKELVDRGFEIYLSLPVSSDNSFFENMGCRIIKTEIDRRGVNPIKDLSLISFYRKTIKELDPRFIFSYTIKPNIYGCIASNGKYKQICNITGTGAVFLNDNIVSKIVKLLYKMSLPKAYKVFFQNEGDRKYFVDNHLVKNNYEVIPGSGCNINEFEFSPLEKKDTVRFLYIGRVMRVKGIDEFLKAAEIIKNQYNNTEFVVAGWNEEENYIKIIDDYNKKNIINYIGFRKDIYKQICDADCIILASHGGEGVPNVLLEAGATGRPCIGSNVNGITDVIINGLNGYLFEKGNQLDLASKIEQFIKLPFDSKYRMGLEGRKNVENRFNREIIINKYLLEVGKIEE